MPYIPMNMRKALNEGLASPESPGELNYVITQTILDYLKKAGKNYANMSAIRGVLADASAEFYRRVMAPYEEDRKQDNGDVYQ